MRYLYLFSVEYKHLGDSKVRIYFLPLMYSKIIAPRNSPGEIKKRFIIFRKKIISFFKEILDDLVRSMVQ